MVCLFVCLSVCLLYTVLSCLSLSLYVSPHSLSFSHSLCLSLSHSLSLSQTDNESVQAAFVQEPTLATPGLTSPLGSVHRSRLAIRCTKCLAFREAPVGRSRQHAKRLRCLSFSLDHVQAQGAFHVPGLLGYGYEVVRDCLCAGRRAPVLLDDERDQTLMLLLCGVLGLLLRLGCGLRPRP